MTSSYGDRKGCTQKDEIAHKPHLMKKPTEPGERGGWVKNHQFRDDIVYGRPRTKTELCVGVRKQLVLKGDKLISHL